MLKELITVFRAKQPMAELGESFSNMLDLSLDMVKQSGEFFFSGNMTPEERTALYKQDVKVNKLQRRIRKEVLVHLSLSENAQDLPYCILLISLVKDVERIGDYAKDLADLLSLSDKPLPDDNLVADLRELRGGIEADFHGTLSIFSKVDRERAIELIKCGRDTVDRCERLIAAIAKADYHAGVAAKMTLATRYYERIAGHVLNILSSVVMPLHKLDYYDEKDIAKSDKIVP